MWNYTIEMKEGFVPRKGKERGKMCKFIEKQLRKGYIRLLNVRNRLSTEPVMLKVCNVKLSFDIWLVLYMHFILYS